MATILCLETSTTNCSVALSVNGSVIALQEDLKGGYSHAEKLHPFIEAVLSEAGIEKNMLDAIAVSKGPGSYTGLRIGVSAAKGLCMSLDIPLISVATLRSLAMQANESKARFFIPLLDARRMEVYASVFEGTSEIRGTKAEILTPASFIEYLEKGTTVFLGNGVSKFSAICDHPNAVFMEETLPSAIQMASLAEAKFKKNDIEDVAYFEPYYLKDYVGG
ncbi:tRNA (adenosine(37)-N6)-threonylcarbamoyltransferase complex dimerization subunit type 1 TsaB [Altibacter sp.]|uniref:tRNA (adenosine(37)-N6)-threonylcarbamoyltransferase complex dimerization subunit type 1 TsaB n=1 Tax=Altibacter sp. TaxID=2024823 RepID=UPI000C994DDE|nr:tRNA (adenosine(37)-N6)-threonylcarbamoyltransferase complex dimerization subunit type 1 TsaB [Altibacter sp.]MAP53944.1 tRNA (adenosine(37)-N6)-threonylcarbamoyltransferase complex dimerization subunit type 1 TsaB [Altibacter sp.]